MNEAESTELREHGKLLAELYAIVTDGMQDTLKEIRENMVSRETCEGARDNCEKLRLQQQSTHRTWWTSLKDVLLIVVALCSLGFGSGIFVRSMANAQQNSKAVQQNEEILQELRNIKADLPSRPDR